MSHVFVMQNKESVRSQVKLYLFKFKDKSHIFDRPPSFHLKYLNKILFTSSDPSLPQAIKWLEFISTSNDLTEALV
jgi:hypothetical protein